MSAQNPRAGESKTGPGCAVSLPGTGSDESTVTQTPTTGGDASSGAAADCSMATDSGGGDDSPGDYNKLKYHSSKIDLNLKILRDQMANLTSSGSSLSRQLASMHRNIQEIKDDDDGEEADSEYESDDEQKPGSIRDAVDTEDDVNKLSDLEKDYSEPKFKRSVSTGSRTKKSKTGARDPNANEVVNDGSQGRHSRSNSRQESVESYPESDSECSQCLCCNSMASYSSTPWRYISRGEGSTMDEDSDSSEYFTDDSEYSTTTSNMPSTDLHKRLSPFYCPSDRGETGSRGDSEEGKFDDAEPAVDHRMSPLGCESPRKTHSQSDLPSMSSKSESNKDQRKSEKMDVGSDKPDSEQKGGDSEDGKGIPASSLIGMFKAQESKAKEQEIASVAKAKRVEELRQKNLEIRLKNEKKRQAELEEKLKNKAKVDNDSAKSSPLVSENDDSEKVNIKDRISSFEGQKKTKEKENAKKEEVSSEKSLNAEKGTNTEPDSLQQMPDVIPGVTEGNINQEDNQKAMDDHHRHKPHKSKSKVARTTIEIPVSCLPEQIIHPEAGMTTDQPTMMTFQVRPGDVEAMNGPILVSRSPKPKRKMSKTIVRLSSTDASPPSVSESTLVPDSDTVRIGINKPSGHSHHVCPHCHKKNKPGEPKRVVKVLQLQPVPESPKMPPMSAMNLSGDSAQIFQQPGGRIIKMIPSKRHVVQRQESSEDGVVFRFNMGMPENAPLQVGDYIRIPIQPQQQQPAPPRVTHVQQGGGGGLVIRTGGQPRRHKEVITLRQTSSRPGGDIRVQQAQSPTSGVTVHTSQPGVRVMPSEGGGVRLVFGS